VAFGTIELTAGRGCLASDEQSRLVQNLRWRERDPTVHSSPRAGASDRRKR
jgi:hypothetical protein